MKIDRHTPQPKKRLPDRPFAGLLNRLNHPKISSAAAGGGAALVVGLWCFGPLAGGQDTSTSNSAPVVAQGGPAPSVPAGQPQPVSPPPFAKPNVSPESDVSPESNVPPESDERSQPQAVHLLKQVIDKIANGPAFDAKIRERVDASGREVVGVGTYEQAGEGSGRFNLQITMHDGDGKHTLQQISDGRLAWTRTEIAKEITLTRVNLGPLKDLAQDTMVRNMLFPYDKDHAEVSPHLCVGGLTELLDSIHRDYVLKLSGGTIHDKQVLIISGEIRQARRQEILQQSGRSDWPELCPTRVRLAIACGSDPETNFGDRLPVLIEFWSDPVPGEGGELSDSPSAKRRLRNEMNAGRRHLISWIELYSIQPIAAPPIGRFEFHHEDPNVNFVDETERYLQRHDVRMTDRQRRLLQR